MKKNYILAVCAAFGVLSMSAHAAANYDYNGYWVYVWNGASGGAWGTASNWGAVRNTTQSSIAAAGGTPQTADVAYIGYTYSYSNGVQLFSQIDSRPAMTITGGGTPKTLFLGDNVTYTAPSWNSSGLNTVYMGLNSQYVGVSNGFSQNRSITFDFGSMTGTSRISMGGFWMQGGSTVNFQGNVTMQADLFSYTLFSSTDLQQNAGTWNASGVSVTDMFGKSLTYAGYVTDASLIESGKYGLVLDGGNVKLMANGTVPEPATATLGLFGLSALMLRRRRK